MQQLDNKNHLLSCRIEMDGIEKLLNTTLYDNDDIGEGVDQNFAVTDQLNLGLRHIEIDITGVCLCVCQLEPLAGL